MELIINGVYELPYRKSGYPATYKQIKWLLKYDNVDCEVSVSQLMKRLPMEDFNELIEAAKSGEKFTIEG